MAKFCAFCGSSVVEANSFCSNCGAPISGAQPAPVKSVETPVASGSFRMVIEDVFTITGRGTVVTGKVESGSARVGDTVNIVDNGQQLMTTTISSIEAFRRKLDEARAGDNVGLLLAGVSRDQVQRGQELVM